MVFSLVQRMFISFYYFCRLYYHILKESGDMQKQINVLIIVQIKVTVINWNLMLTESKLNLLYQKIVVNLPQIRLNCPLEIPILNNEMKNLFKTNWAWRNFICCLKHENNKSSVLMAFLLNFYSIKYICTDSCHLKNWN